MTGSLVIPAKAGMGRPRDDGFFSSFRQRPAWAGLGMTGSSRHSGKGRHGPASGMTGSLVIPVKTGIQ
jgi:hypothetical protein